MAYFELDTITVTTAADGSATAYSSKTFNGKVQSIGYTKVDFADGVDFTITTETTGQNVWVDTNINATETVRPRATVHDTTGAPLQHGTANPFVTDHIPLVNERLKFVIASGGNVKTGTFQIIVGG